MTVAPGTPRWRALVLQGILKTDSENWFLGDTALEIGPRHLPAYAEEISVPLPELEHYAEIARSWPRSRRVVGTSWKVHEMLVDRQGLLHPGLTVTGAHRALGQSTAGRTGPRSDPAARAAQVKAALQDPEVAREVMSDNQTAAAALNAHTRVANERAAQLGQRRAADPGHVASEQASDWAVAMHELAKANEALSKVVARLASQSLGLRHRVELDRELDQIGVKIEFLLARANGSSAGLDDELRALLS